MSNYEIVDSVETLEKAITPYSHLIFENKSYQVYEQAKYYGEIEKNNLDAYLGTNTMPTAEERSFLLS